MTEDWAPDDETLRPAFDSWRAGQHGQARNMFATRLVADPTCVDAWRGIGSVDWSSGCFSHALEAFAKALRLAPHVAMHWVNVGLTLRDLGQPTRAQAVLSVALQIDPTYLPASNELANAYVDQGRYADALPLYEHVLDVDPTRAVYHHNHGVCLRLLGRPDEAATALHAALQIDPQYAWSIVELKRCQDANA